MITGGVAYHNGRLYVPVSSLEEGTAAIPTYECCTFRGSVVALDAASGKQVWKTYTISQAPQRTTKTARGTQLWGPSGGAVWSQPAVDAERNRIYISTGDNYSNPPARESDAIMALAMDTGRVLWIQQTLADDAWNVGCLETGAGRVNCPEGAGPDHDFSSSPSVGVLPDGKRDHHRRSEVRRVVSGSTQTPASSCGKRRSVRAASWAASSGASASMRRRPTCRSRMRSRRNLARRAEWSR